MSMCHLYHHSHFLMGHLPVIYSFCGGCAKESLVCHLSSPLSSEVHNSEEFVHQIIQRISNLIPAVYSDSTHFAGSTCIIARLYIIL